MHSTNECRFWVVIPAAGSGRRMESSARPKQYLQVAGRTILEWAVAPFLRHEHVAGLVIVLAAEDRFWATLPLSANPRIASVQGGAARADSVRAGLDSLAAQARADDWVLVHDAARPCLSDEDLNRLVVTLSVDPVGGLLAVPLVDTLKRADGDGRIIETLPRANVWRALTPQMYRYGVLRRALGLAAEREAAVTDESQAIELLGLQPRLVPGSANNLKVTTAADLESVARMLADRGER